MLNDYPKSRSDCPNCPKCFVVVPSVSDGKIRNASRAARALHRDGSAQRVSKMRLKGVQNVSVDPQMTQMIKTKKDFSVPLCLCG